MEVFEGLVIERFPYSFNLPCVPFKYMAYIFYINMGNYVNRVLLVLKCKI